MASDWMWGFLVSGWSLIMFCFCLKHPESLGDEEEVGLQALQVVPWECLPRVTVCPMWWQPQNSRPNCWHVKRWHEDDSMTTSMSVMDHGDNGQHSPSPRSVLCLSTGIKPYPQAIGTVFHLTCYASEDVPISMELVQRNGQNSCPSTSCFCLKIYLDFSPPSPLFILWSINTITSKCAFKMYRTFPLRKSSIPIPRNQEQAKVAHMPSHFLVCLSVLLLKVMNPSKHYK